MLFVYFKTIFFVCQVRHIFLIDIYKSCFLLENKEVVTKFVKSIVGFKNLVIIFVCIGWPKINEGV